MQGRHYGMDWLRIGAFALLILYHVGMIYVPWDFHVNARVTQDWVQYPMLALNPWRLSLLFVVSGFASRNLFDKLGSTGRFAAARTRRLLIPLLFGVIVIVPPQSWIELMVKNGYPHGLLHFWSIDYFCFGTLAGIILPTWNHLWFIVYLLLYTLILSAIMWLAGRRAPCFQWAFDRLFGSWGLIALPIAYLMLMRSLLFPRFGETHALYDDWAAHPVYFFAFLFGFGLARSAPAWAMLRARGSLLITLALLSGAAFLSLDSFAPVEWTRFARSIFSWSAILALIAIADRYWNRDHRWRAMLSEAVFPFYIIHQTIIIVAIWWLQPFAIDQVVEFALIVVATALGCWFFYRWGRAVPMLRLLIGLEGYHLTRNRS